MQISYEYFFSNAIISAEILSVARILSRYCSCANCERGPRALVDVTTRKLKASFFLGMTKYDLTKYQYPNLMNDNHSKTKCHREMFGVSSNYQVTAYKG